MNSIKIFISSVQKEFVSERLRIYDWILSDALLSQYFIPVLFEKLPAVAQRPSELYLDEVRNSQIYLVILGQEYGYEDANGMSPTELEYECAKKSNLYKLAFIKGDSSLERNIKQRKFVSKIQNELTYKRFDNIEILISQIYAALIEYLKTEGLIHTKSFDESLSDATIAAISSEKVDNFLALANARRGFPLAKGTSAEKVLTHLRMLSDGKLSNSALLAFGNDPQYYFHTAIVKCAYFLGTRWEKPIEDHKVFEGDVFEQVNAAVSFVMSKIGTSVGLREESVQAPIKNEIPRPVIFEAIVNAVAHRDYRSNGSVQVMVFTDRIVVLNPGRLSPELSPAKIKETHGSFPTNPLLAEAMYQAGYIERFGTGVNEMIRLSLEAGLKEPEFDFSGGISITLWRSAKTAVRTENAQKTHRKDTETARKPQENHKKTARKPQENRELILTSLKSNPAISLCSMAEDTGLSYGSLRHHLEKMREEGIIRREGADKGGRWIVVE
ncbi:MAG: DUF4062 domain-containing protein [Culturomica sp.]|jgi:predicted HTH transcriptional regulator|nr:DUF4062 domain-containing protein [Culturomica sp.]